MTLNFKINFFFGLLINLLDLSIFKKSLKFIIVWFSGMFNKSWSGLSIPLITLIIFSNSREWVFANDSGVCLIEFKTLDKCIPKCSINSIFFLMFEIRVYQKYIIIIF